MNDDVKKIVDLFKELLPWDKGEALKYLVNHEMTYDEIEKYFIEGTGYIHRDDIDYVQGVVDNDLQYDVLDNMDDSEIISYLTAGGYASDNLREMIEVMFKDDVATVLININSTYLEDALEEMKKLNKQKLIALKETIENILTDE